MAAQILPQLVFRAPDTLPFAHSGGLHRHRAVRLRFAPPATQRGDKSALPPPGVRSPAKYPLAHRLIMPPHPPDHLSQKGNTMLEVLVAIVVFSFGMLGLLGLMLNSLKMTSTSNYRSIAAEQFVAISEILNANPSLISSYIASSASSTITSNCLNTTGCTAGQMQATDYGLWQQQLAMILPSGQGVICSDSTPTDGVAGTWACDGLGRPTVKICWNESRVSSATNWSAPCFSAQL